MPYAGRPVDVLWPQPWGPRVPPRFRLTDHHGVPVPEAVALVDAATAVLVARRRGETPSPYVKAWFARTLRAEAYRGRTRRSAYSKGSDGVGELDRLAVAAEGALRVAAALLELRDVRLRDTGFGGDDIAGS